MKNFFLKSISFLLCFCMMLTVEMSVLSTPVFAQQSGTAEITDLRVNDRIDPEGIDDTNPTFGWKMESNIVGQYQTAYEIVVQNRTDDSRTVWDSGKVWSNVSQGIPYEGETLLPETDYSWQLTVYDKDGKACEVQSASFSTGLMVAVNASDKSHTSFTIEVDFSILSGAFGFLFGASDSNNFLMWQVSAQAKSLRPHQWTGGTPSVIAETSLSAIASSSEQLCNQPLHMRIVVNNGKIDTYIEDTLIESRTMSPFDLGNVGFRQVADQNERAEVSRVYITDDQGNTLFEENFDDPEENKFLGGTVTDNGTLLVEDALFFQKDDSADPLTQVTSFTAELDFKVIRTALGFVLGATDTNNFYLWEINAENGDNGSLRIHKRSGGDSVLSEKSLQQIFNSKDDILGTEAHLKIVVDNGAVQTYLNDVLMDTITVSPFTPGKLGLRQIRSGELDEIAEIDNLSIRDKDGNLLFEDDFSDGANPNFLGASITKDGWMRGENGFFLRQEPLSVEGWDNAQWIGAPYINVDAGTVPVYNISFDLQLSQGSSKAGAVLCANDKRFLDRTKNNYRIEGENYVLVELDASGILSGGSATVNIYRKGYCNEDYAQPNNTSLLRSCALTGDLDVGLDASNLNQKSLRFRLVSRGGSIDVIINDKTITNVIVNPTGVTQDVACSTVLNNVGFRMESGQKAKFGNFQICTYDSPQTTIFSKEVGAGYAAFGTPEGLTFDGETITVDGGSEGILALADPSYRSTPMLRREVTAGQKPVSAKLYVTARGIYEMYLNGQRIGDDWFNPGYTQYNKTITYSTYDVTDMVQQGENAIGAWIASGWWSDQMTFSLQNYNYFGNKPALMAKLVLCYADGSKETIVTDREWQVFGDGPITYAGFFNGEAYDATRDATVEGFSEPGFSGEGWEAASIVPCKPQHQNAAIVARTDEPVRVVQTLDAKFDKEVEPNIYVYDMGTNMTGVPRITLPELPAGTKITLRYGEIYYPELDEDNPYCYGELGGKLLTENLRAALCTDTYIAKGEAGGETYTPRFTFHGYRYLEISGLSEPLPEENIKGLVISSIQEVTATYDSSNPLTNQLHQNIVRSLLGNHVSIPTDCPQRDERMGWTGDAQVFSRTATYYGDLNLLYEGWENTVRDTQSYSGWIPDVVPNVGFGSGGAITWPAASVIPVWECYKQYGNTRLISDHLQSMKAFLDVIRQERVPAGSYLITGYDLTEHLALIDTDSCLCSNVIYAYMLDIFSRMAKAVGEGEIAAEYSQLADHVKQEWNRTFINTLTGKTVSAGGSVQDTQASYALAIEYGVINEENMVKAAEYLDEACARGYDNVPYTITTGFIGTGALLPALTRSGNLETAYKMFEQTEYASWLYPVTQGATSIWERWNGYTIENGFGGLNSMNSFNHYAAGAVGAWMINYHVGIASDEDRPGFQSFILQPLPGGNFTYVNGGYQSYYGKIESNWTAQDGQMTSYDARVPANTTATLYLPATAEQTEGMQLIHGISYQGMTQRNGISAVQLQLQSGGYHFELQNGKWVVSLMEGYTDDNTSAPMPEKEALTVLVAKCKAINLDLYENGAGKTSFEDALEKADGVLGNGYAYQTEIDEAEQALRTALAGLIRKAITLELTASGLHSQIQLQWKPSDGEDEAAYYIVYRDGLQLAQTNDGVYVDTAVIEGGWYRYEVQAVFEDGTRSKLSASVAAKCDNSKSSLPRDNWVGAAFDTHVTTTVNRAFDSDVTSDWFSGQPLRDGQWFMVDMGQPYAFDRIQITLQANNDFPDHFMVSVSDDGETWREAGEGNGASALYSCTFPLQIARYVKITVIDTSKDSWWNIRDLDIGLVGDSNVGELDRSGWTASAFAQHPDRPPSNAIDADMNSEWYSAVELKSGQWFMVDMGKVQEFNCVTVRCQNNGDHPAFYEISVSDDGVEWSQPVGRGKAAWVVYSLSFPLQKARYIKITAVDTDSSSWWNIQDFSVSRLSESELPRCDWVASASNTFGGETPDCALDGNNVNTRWLSGYLPADISNVWFQIDMGQTTTFNTVVMDSQNTDYPTAYNLLVSDDGSNWRVAAENLKGSAYAELSFPVQTARYLRVVPVGSFSSSNNWAYFEFYIQYRQSVDTPELSRDGWIATGSQEANNQIPEWAIDKSLETRFSPGVYQKPGQWFQLDLGKAESFNKIVLQNRSDYPVGYELFLSTDGNEWQSIAVGQGTAGSTVITFPNMESRYVKLVQTGESNSTWWSIYDISILDDERLHDLPVSGDINSDGATDADDLRLLRRALLGTVAMTETEEIAADVNRDGNMDIRDLVRLKKIAGM